MELHSMIYKDKNKALQIALQALAVGTTGIR